LTARQVKALSSVLRCLYQASEALLKRFSSQLDGFGVLHVICWSIDAKAQRMGYLHDMKEDDLMDLLARYTDEYLKFRVEKINTTHTERLKQLLKELQKEIQMRKEPIGDGH
jgi:hypothetical protein